MFWQSERATALREVADAEHIELESFQRLIGEYIYSQKVPLSDDIINLMPEDKQPGVLTRQSVGDRIKQAIIDIVDVFEW